MLLFMSEMDKINTKFIRTHSYTTLLVTKAYDVTHNTGVTLRCARQSDVFNIFHTKPKGLQGDVTIPYKAQNASLTTINYIFEQCMYVSKSNIFSVLN